MSHKQPRARKTERQQFIAALRRMGISYRWEDEGAISLEDIIFVFDPNGRFDRYHHHGSGRWIERKSKTRG
jgi:hypothetical protein